MRSRLNSFFSFGSSCSALTRLGPVLPAVTDHALNRRCLVVAEKFGEPALDSATARALSVGELGRQMFQGPAPHGQGLGLRLQRVQVLLHLLFGGVVEQNDAFLAVEAGNSKKPSRTTRRIDLIDEFPATAGDGDDDGGDSGGHTPKPPNKPHDRDMGRGMQPRVLRNGALDQPETCAQAAGDRLGQRRRKVLWQGGECLRDGGVGPL